MRKIDNSTKVETCILGGQPAGLRASRNLKKFATMQQYGSFQPGIIADFIYPLVKGLQA
jgi:hypothetical protein